MKLETENEIEYKSTIMEMRNIIKNQERVIEQLMFDMLNIKIDIEEVEGGLVPLLRLKGGIIFFFIFL